MLSFPISWGSFISLQREKETEAANEKASHPAYVAQPLHLRYSLLLTLIWLNGVLRWTSSYLSA